MILTQFETNIRILHLDNARYYYLNILGEYLQKSIIHHSLCLDTPQQNGVLEKKKIVIFLRLPMPWYSKWMFGRCLGRGYFNSILFDQQNANLSLEISHSH